MKNVPSCKPKNRMTTPYNQSALAKDRSDPPRNMDVLGLFHLRSIMRYFSGFLLGALLALCLGPCDSYADSWTLRGGPGISADGPTGATKMFGMRTESLAFKGLYSANEFGAWVDNRPGASNAAFTKAQLGVVTGQERGWFAKAFVGPALISSRDAYLGGFLQFAEDFGIGLRDKDTSVSISYSHFSSAGLSSPNKGKDFLVFEIGILW